jgi:uncharacterized protein YdeI (YjbR/CyaY-like superfamily)
MNTGKKCITYREALEEALCFGWIDSTIKKLDEESYVRKFTPRNDIANWSDLNKSIVLSLIEKGRMTQAGLNKMDVYLKTGKVHWETGEPKKANNPDDTIVPPYILEELGKNEPALINFTGLAPSYRKQYLYWITSAKREETIRARLNEAVSLLKQNRKLGLK